MGNNIKDLSAFGDQLTLLYLRFVLGSRTVRCCRCEKRRCSMIVPAVISLVDRMARCCCCGCVDGLLLYAQGAQRTDVLHFVLLSASVCLRSCLREDSGIARQMVLLQKLAGRSQWPDRATLPASFLRISPRCVVGRLPFLNCLRVRYRICPF